MASQRAIAGGGTERGLTPSVQVSYGGTPGEGAAWFGPGQPMAPQAPEEVRGRAFDFPQAVNTYNQQRKTATFSYDTLRAFADHYDLLRIIIETRKDAMERLGWVIQQRDPSEKLSPQKKNRIKEITKFFLKPDREHSWNTWLRMLLEDLFVIDAPCLHRRRTRNGQLYALEQIDGATIRRVLDDWGHTPEDPDETAYQQFLKGMPAVNYRKDDLFFRPRNQRINRIYGFGPVEQIVMTINIGIRRQVFQLDFFSEGNMPSALIGVPEGWTPDQIRVFQQWFDNMLAGNLAERSKAKFVPSAVGKTYIPTQETELFGKAEEWLARVVCFAFSVSPQPFLQMMNRATADSAAQEAAATGLSPIQNWVKSLIDDVLAEDFDAADLEFVWRGDDELDPTKRQAITEKDVKSGLLTLNEGRVANGRDPYDDPRFDEPMFMTSNGLAPLVAEDGTTHELQGAADPKQLAGTTEAGTDPSQVEDESVEDKIAKFVAARDEAGLTQFLAGLKEQDDE